jgi:23S rRNA (adenine2503-C2)-methyltransferase
VLTVERWHGSRTVAPADDESGDQSQTGSTGCQSAASRVSNPPAPGGSERRSSNRLIDNLVIMGMGEPLANYEALMQALRILNASWGGKIGARKITISTSGLAPQIRRLAEEPEQFRLALSLHGATDQVRNRLMPVNRKYPLAELLAAMEYYRGQKGRMITLEFILIAGVNDALEQARLLAVIARKLHARVNLIPYNQVEDFSWERPSEAAQEAFLKVLLDRQVMATLRREKGGDIDAACGQLRLKTERARKVSEGGAPRRSD